MALGEFMCASRCALDCRDVDASGLVISGLEVPAPDAPGLDGAGLDGAGLDVSTVFFFMANRPPDSRYRRSACRGATSISLFDDCRKVVLTA
jgi:hypothetical protein